MNECKTLVIGLTICTYRHEGLRRGDFRQVLRSLLASLEQETGLQAGAYTRPLPSSTSAIVDTNYTLNSPKYLLTPPARPLNNPYTTSNHTPYPTESAYFEL